MVTRHVVTFQGSRVNSSTVSRRFCAGAISFGLVISGVALALIAPPATALSPGVAFSAEGMSTWQTNGVVWALGQSQGRVVAGGDFTALRPPEGGAGTALSVTGLAILDAQTG